MAAIKLDKLKALPWHIQLCIFVGVGVLLFGAFWYFVTSGMRVEIATMSEQIETLKKQNAELQVAQQRVNELRENFKMRESEYDELKVLLPEQREITNVLRELQVRAGNNNLSLNRFTPGEDVLKDFYSGKPVAVEISSNFGGLRQFFDEMAQYQRLVSITDFSLKQASTQTANRTLDSKFMLTAFFATPEQLNNLTPPPAPTKGGKPGAPPAKPGAPAAAPPAK